MIATKSAILKVIIKFDEKRMLILEKLISPCVTGLDYTDH